MHSTRKWRAKYGICIFQWRECNERPGRQQEDRLLALAVDLVEEPHPVALDEPFGVWVAGAALLAVAAGRLAGRPGDRVDCGVHAPLADRSPHGRASNTRLNGVSAARRKRVNPPPATTSPIRASPA